MDWTWRGRNSLLIIMTISWISVFSNTANNSTSRCQMEWSKDCWMIIIDGGFNGQIQIPNTTTGSEQFNKSFCLFSFDTNDTNYNEGKFNKDCSYEKLGVWLLKNANSTHQIVITRNMQPEKPICFVPHTDDCTNDTLKNYISNWMRNNSDPKCVNVTCFDLKQQCNNAELTTSWKKSSIITLNGTSVKCQIGGNFKQTDKHITSEELKINENFTSGTSSYFDVIKILNANILHLMENSSSASLSLGNISGIFLKANTSAPQPISFMYTVNTNFNVLETGAEESMFQSMFYIPKEAFEKAQNQNNTTVFAGLLRIPNFAQDEKNSFLLENEVFSIDMGTHISGLLEPVNLTFKVHNETQLVPKCHSWNGNGSKPNWTTDGCNTTITDTEITCTCTHLTFFALLMSDPNQGQLSEFDLTNLTYITSIGCGLSIFFLSVALIMHFLLRRGQTGASVKILMNLFLALFLLNFTFLTNESVASTENPLGCQVMASLMHYSMLSSFQWFFLVALHLCLQFAKNLEEIKKYITMIHITGWVLPAIIVIANFATGKYGSLNSKTDMGTNINMCWITDKIVLYGVNIGFYAVVFLFTFIVFVVMLHFFCMLQKNQPNVKKNLKKKTKSSDASAIMGLFFLLGLGWGFAFFAFGVMRVPALYIFTILNSFQGFFLFIYYYRSSTKVEIKTPSDQTSFSQETVVENPYNLPKLS